MVARDQAVDIIARLRARLGHGHGAETRLVETILDDLQFATHASVSELAGRAGVSEPTITRLARTLGLKSTREMKVHLAQALAVGGAYLRPATDVRDTADVVSTVCARAHAALDLISVALSTADAAGLGLRLSQASRIVIHGTGGSSSMAANELHNRLFRLGLNTSAYADPQLQRMSASVLDGGAVLVAFSISGRAQSIIDAAAIARQYGAHVVAITVPESPLARAADTIVPFHFREDGNLYKPSSSRYALLAVLDVLAMATAEAMGPAVLERLRRVRQSLASTEMADPDYPIGD